MNMGAAKKTIDIDVFVLSYNQERYIRDALHGVNSQIVASNIITRVIIADDCSSDRTLEFIKECEAESGNAYCYLSSPARIGMAQNYSRIIGSAKGDYICILEGDDFWIDRNKIQKQVDYMENNPACVICYTDCDIQYEDQTGHVTGRDCSIFSNSHHTIDSQNPLFETMYQGNTTWMIRADLLRSINVPSECSDVPLVIMYEACLHGRVDYLPGPSTAIFRRHRGSVSNSGDKYKQYLYSKNVFLLRESYAEKFACSSSNMRRLYCEALKDLYRSATDFRDLEIKSKIENRFTPRRPSGTSLYDIPMRMRFLCKYTKLARYLYRSHIQDD